jgi:hypothetical protein
LKFARAPKLLDDIQTFLHKLRHKAGHDAELNLIV